MTQVIPESANGHAAADTGLPSDAPFAAAPQPQTPPVSRTPRSRPSGTGAHALVGRNAGLMLVYMLVAVLPAVAMGMISAAESSSPGLALDLDGTRTSIAQCVGPIAATIVLLVMRRRQVADREFWLGASDRRRMTPSSFAALAVVLIAIGGLSEAVMAALKALFALFGVSLTSIALNLIDSTMNESLLMVVSVVVLAPITEEILCRGMMMGDLRERGKMFAIVTPSVLFGMLHGDLLQGLSAAMGGLLLGYIAMEYSLVWAMVFHFVNNGVLSTWLPMAFGLLPDAAEKPAYYVFLVVGSVLGLAVLWWRRAAIRDYIAANRSPRGSYVGWTSLRFLLLVLYCAVVSSAGFSLM
ncbi:CPBP family intramembrane metalloprotease [Bifidobacterium amazonense]|uniref:CPBP family intramembrane metalloprotease n=1 Tax=Bifidobacterium amazonense TaxID=2809027 RepID=A0ABS9VYP3_9BIFI|nr:CPBP family intramembrane glutamic endopeptidase [Bifidobacterium amazonense]MCH9277177.1 CPBP family intramembrane metalloprotease [Bifidobacterium amazonense]